MKFISCRRKTIVLYNKYNGQTQHTVSQALSVSNVNHQTEGVERKERRPILRMSRQESCHNTIQSFQANCPANMLIGDYPSVHQICITSSWQKLVQFKSDQYCRMLPVSSISRRIRFFIRQQDFLNETLRSYRIFHLTQNLYITIFRSSNQDISKQKLVDETRMHACINIVIISEKIILRAK